MVLSRSILALCGLVGAGQAAYVLKDNYDSKNFFDGFDFMSGPDPTHGHVKYLNREAAMGTSLARYDGGQVYLGADAKTPNAPNGRQSVRVESKKTYTKGLFVADVTHMPVGCGVWPALWTFGPGWPKSGEIDIIEGVHTTASNTATLHTAGNTCHVKNAGSIFEGKKALKKADCGAPGGAGFEGCGQEMNPGTFGQPFNAKQGGVYAMEWTSQHIAVWFFPRGSPQIGNALSASPNPSTWGKPMARFTGCNIDQHFKDHKIIINTTFCGDWAGKKEIWDATCKAQTKANSCIEFVSKNAGAFSNAFWKIKTVKVYQNNGRKRDVRSHPRAFRA